jgi:uncharacterized protein (DUF305 family)
VTTARPRRRTAFTTLCGGAVIAVTLSACAAPTAPPQIASAVSTAFNGTDLAWLQLLVPMTDNAVTLLRLAPANGHSAALVTEAAAVAASQETVSAQLHVLRDRAGLPSTDIHEGHQMPGMVTEADLIAMRDTRGDEFDTRLTALLDAHLDQSVLLSTGEQRSGQDKDIKALAARIAREWPALRQKLAPR